MTVNSINSVGSITNPNVNFKKTTEKQLEKNKTSKDDKTMMIVAGLTAAAALTVAGIMIARGRKPKPNPQKPVDIPKPEVPVNKPDNDVVNNQVKRKLTPLNTSHPSEIKRELEAKKASSLRSVNNKFLTENVIERADREMLRVGQTVDGGLYTVKKIEYDTRYVKVYKFADDEYGKERIMIVDVKTNKPTKIIDRGHTYFVKPDGTMGCQYGSKNDLNFSDKKEVVANYIKLLQDPEKLKKETILEYNSVQRYIRNLELETDMKKLEETLDLKYQKMAETLERNDFSVEDPSVTLEPIFLYLQPRGGIIKFTDGDFV